MSDNFSLSTYLAQNPKMAGALFTLVLFLSQTSTVMAGVGSGYGGP